MKNVWYTKNWYINDTFQSCCRHRAIPECYINDINNVDTNNVAGNIHDICVILHIRQCYMVWFAGNV